MLIKESKSTYNVTGKTKQQSAIYCSDESLHWCVKYSFPKREGKIAAHLKHFKPTSDVSTPSWCLRWCCRQSALQSKLTSIIYVRVPAPTCFFCGH